MDYKNTVENGYLYDCPGCGSTAESMVVYNCRNCGQGGLQQIGVTKVRY